MSGIADNPRGYPGSRAGGLRQEFELLLRTARQRLRRARLRAQTRIAVDCAIWTVTILAGAYCLLRLGCLAAGRAVPIGWAGYGWLVLAGAIAAAAAAMLAALRDVPSLREAAERLDLSAQDHNRIAIGLALADSGTQAAFARAAIEDGLSYLRRLKEAIPYLDAARPMPRGSLYRAIAFCGLTALTALVGNAPTDIAIAKAGAPAAARASAEGRPAGEPANGRRNPATPAAAQSQPAVTSGNRKSVATSPAGRPPAGLRNEAGTGRTGGEVGAEASPSDRSASARGDSTDTSATAPVPKRKDARTSTPKPSKESKVLAGQKPEKGEESSSIGQGASGGGAMSAVQNAWSQRDQAKEGDRQENESEEKVEEEKESSTQRGGIQPSLKDRTDSPQRELGIPDAQEGPPGTGRGGPTPPKKSRGTASLVLGVPVPDFVKGRVGPGTTKITHERVEPSPMPGDASVAAPAARRSQDETPCRRFEVPSAFAAVVRNYLVALHSADQRVSTEDRRPAAPGQTTDAGRAPAVQE